MPIVWQKVLRYKTWIIGLVVLVLVVTVGTTIYRSRQAAVPVAQTVQVERGNVISLVSATGTITPLSIVDVSSKISGLIEEMKVKENDQVTVGQVLLVLDDSRLQALVAQAQARLENVGGIYDRNRRLEGIGAIATQALDTSRSEFTVAQAVYDDAVSQLNDTIIRSPINGQVIGKPIPAGQAVAPGVSTPMVLLTIADMSQMQIETQVDESDVGKIQVGQKVSFTVDAYPTRIFSGVVANISQKANVVSNVVYYKTLVDVDAAKNLLKPTMTARVSITVAESKNTLFVPLAAVKSNNSQQYVIVVTSSKFQNTPVTTGLTGDDKVEILSGLTEGVQVVVPSAKVPTSGSAKGGGIPGMGR